MSETTTTQRLQACIDRFARGDASARDQLLALAFDRLTALTRRMLNDYDRLRAWEQTDDVLQNATVRLLKSLQEVTPRTSREFYGLAALHVRRELLDLCRHHFGRKGHEHRGMVHERPAGGDASADDAAAGRAPDASDSTHDPQRLAVWTEFHQEVERLPPDEREAVDLLWYQELSQEEAAEVLGVDPSTVKRRWRSARLKLAEALKGALPGM